MEGKTQRVKGGTSKKPRKPQSKKMMLTDEKVETILGIIDGWQGKLTYDKLLDAVASRLKHRFTRQTLFAYVRIREAIAARKETLKGGSPARQVKSVELKTALDRIERLEAEVQRLKQENDSLLHQFVRWAHNAFSQNLSIEFLNQDVGDVDRRATKLTPAKKPPIGPHP